MKIDRTVLRRSWESWISMNLEVAGPYWLQLVWTATFSALLALGFTVLGFVIHADTLDDWLRADRWLIWLGRNLVVALVIGYAIHGLFELVGRLAGKARICRFTTLQRVLFYGGVPVVAVGAGWPLGIWLAGGTVRQEGDIGPIATTAAFALLITFIAYNWFAAKAQAIEAERRATEAQLRLLQAQIEPHFLFNTLANVHALIEHDAGKARAMLGAFTDYLRASLAGLRREAVPLADELALAEAYLRVQAARMEGRLAWRIEADEAARGVLLPPLLLQPLVENAVLHGLEPQIEGGTVLLRAQLEQDTLVIEVHDDGCGLGASRAPPRRGTGVALANVRARLAASHGAAASLTLAAAAPGTRATLRLPATQAAETPRP